MALDLHFGVDVNAAAKTAPKLQIEHFIHDDVFGKLFYKDYKKLTTKYLLLERLSDHYSDAIFLCDELPNFIKELNQVIFQFTKDTHKKLLNDLISLSNEAISKKQNLYFFCD